MAFWMDRTGALSLRLFTANVISCVTSLSPSDAVTVTVTNCSLSKSKGSFRINSPFTILNLVGSLTLKVTSSPSASVALTSAIFCGSSNSSSRSAMTFWMERTGGVFPVTVMSTEAALLSAPAVSIAT